jgi:hypothetical protein
MSARNGKTVTARKPARRKAAVRPGSRPKAPADLQTAGTTAWDLLWSLPQMVFPGDLPLVLRLCHVQDEMSAVRSSVVEQGHVFEKPVQTAGGAVIGTEPVVHPGLLALRRLGAEAGELCSALGIGPNARHSLGLTADPPPDFVDELKARRQRRRRAAGIED